MISELFLYGRENSLFKSILSQSAIIKGNYHISPDYGHNLNTDNLDSFVKDPVYGLDIIKPKYPLALCMTPRSRGVSFNGQRWEEFTFNIWFLTTDKTQNNQQKKLDKATNTSGQQPWEDWDDMKQAASDFYEILKQLILKGKLSSGQLLLTVIRFNNDTPTIFQRVARVQNDRLNGVCLSFILCAFTDACLLKDYAADAVSKIVIPPLENYSGS